MRNKASILRGLDHHGELHGGLFHLDRRLRVGVQRAVNDIGPIHQIRHRCWIEAEALLRDHRNKTGARLEARIVKLAITLLLLEMSGISRAQKCALMVIEPPGDLGRGRVLEIDNCVLLAIEIVLVEKRAGAMQETRKRKLHVAADPLAVETGEQGSR